MTEYQGRTQVGTQVPLLFLTKSPPDAAPVWTLYADATGAVVATGSLYPDFDGGAATTFRFPHMLNVTVTAGTFTYVVRYAVSGSPRLQSVNIRVMPAGDSRGAVTSICSFRFAENQFLLHSTDGGDIYSGKNPSF